MTALENTTAVITGASSGIGRGIARLLAHEGSHVFITGRDAERLQKTAESIEQEGGVVTTAAFDLTDSDKLHAFIKDTAKASGRLDIMVNAAGVDHPGTIAAGDLADWRDLFDTHVIAVLVRSHAPVPALPQTQGQGHTATLSSFAGRRNGIPLYRA